MSTIHRATAFAVVATAALATACSVPASGDSGATSLQRNVNAVRATGVTGVVAEVQTADNHTAARAGAADLTTGRKPPWNGYYRIGSITKTFTATVMLQLIGEGRLKLTDSAEHWFPGLVHGNGNDGRRITVQNLIGQTSGLNDYDNYLPWAIDFTPQKFRAERFHAYTSRQLVAMAMRKPPKFLPRRDNPAAETRWDYSNTNYVLADMIIEKVTGHSWQQEVYDRIIAPLGLRHTFSSGTSGSVPQPAATAYTRFPGHTAPVDTTIFVPLPDAPLISTTDDVATFFRALLGGRLLRPAQMAQMKRTVAAPDDIEPGARYGLGIFWHPVKGCTTGVWENGGDMPGYVSDVAVTPDGRRAAATYASTWSLGDQRQDNQDRATVTLINHALCG